MLTMKCSMQCFFSFVILCGINVLAEDCPGGQVWNYCGSACTKTCDEPAPICTAVCVTRCECPPGYPIWHDNTCIKEQFCPNTNCPGGQVWKECGSPCTKTCSDPSPVCIEVCEAKCECPPEFPIWDKYNCIKEDQCKQCLHGQEWTECVGCTRTCANPTQCLPIVCEAGCQCPPNFPIWHNNKCIKEESCPRECPKGQVWSDCVGCPSTCDNPLVLCLAICEPGCKCPDEFPILHHNECIEPEDCLQNQCSGGQVWNDCGTLCPLHCETAADLVTFPQECNTECTGRCECPSDRPYLRHGRCITFEHCYRVVGPCDVGAPLKGERGEEIFCGRGPSHQDCPANSHCVVHPADRFAVCCAYGR